MRVLITGGAGYLGTELTYRIAERQEVEEILVYDNLSRRNYNLFIIPGPVSLDKVRFIRGDVLDSRRLRKVLRDVDVVYHLAARVTTPYSDESADLYEQVNHWGTAELVAAVEDSSVSRFIFTSSASVYGFSDEMINANTPTHPKTYYASSKLRAEAQVERLADKMETFIVRCANVYGYSKSMRFDAVINRFLFSANAGEPITIYGSGGQIRSFVSVSNASRCLERLLDTQRPSSVSNLVDRQLSVLELVDSIRAIYPHTETLFVSQHVEPRHLRVDVNGSLGCILGINADELGQELHKFSANLAIQSAK